MIHIFITSAGLTADVQTSSSGCLLSSAYIDLEQDIIIAYPCQGLIHIKADLMST